MLLRQFGKKKKVIWDIVYLIIEVELQPFHIYSPLFYLYGLGKNKKI